ncbi:MAG: A24 family peptidase [Hyphomicrobiaceae bacterium]
MAAPFVRTIAPEMSPAKIFCATLIFYALLAFTKWVWDGANVQPHMLLISTVLAVLLAILTAIDLQTFRLPDAITLPLIVLGLSLSALVPTPALLERVAAAAVAYAMLAGVASLYQRLRRRPGLGLGDAKLFAASGSWLGLLNLPTVLLIASTSALLLIVIRILRDGGSSVNEPIAFGPFLAFGFWCVWILSL